MERRVSNFYMRYQSLLSILVAYIYVQSGATKKGVCKTVIICYFLHACQMVLIFVHINV